MSSAPTTHAQLHHAIMQQFVERGYAPTVAQLSSRFDCTPAAMIDALRALEAYHGVVLHPKSGEVWTSHPFSAAPTAFWIAGRDGGWWGNCAWCALGVAVLVGEDVTITSRYGGESESVVIAVRNGSVEPAGCVVHFPIPMARVWDNVIYTCSTMLLFPAEAAVDAWCERHAISRGDVQPIQRVWELAKAWYGNHLGPAWTKWTSDEAREIFARAGLSGPVWEVPQTADRF
jgi:Alkylmercury lyase